MNIFADLHHGALSYSLHLLFEKRLGWELYNPIGMGWRDEGFWQYSQLEDTIHSYLDIKNDFKDHEYFYTRFDRDFEWKQKFVTIDQFMKMKWDALLCSVGPHEDTFYDLQQRYKPKAKLIRQIGNWNEEVDFNKSKNVMISVGPFVCPDFVNHICYHQEFDLKDWCYTPPVNSKNISTFINCFPDTVDFDLWHIYKEQLPEIDFKMFGIRGADGNLSPQAKVRVGMKGSGLVWQVKLGGEGFGHVIHNAYALGRPCIVKKSYYRGKMAEPLLIDDRTCIDLDAGSLETNLSKIRFWSRPENYRKMSRAAYERFNEVCDFNREEKAIRKFLKRLK